MQEHAFQSHLRKARTSNRLQATIVRNNIASIVIYMRAVTLCDDIASSGSRHLPPKETAHLSSLSIHYLHQHWTSYQPAKQHRQPCATRCRSTTLATTLRNSTARHAAVPSGSQRPPGKPRTLQEAESTTTTATRLHSAGAELSSERQTRQAHLHHHRVATLLNLLRQHQSLFPRPPARVHRTSYFALNNDVDLVSALSNEGFFKSEEHDRIYQRTRSESISRGVDSSREVVRSNMNSHWRNS